MSFGARPRGLHCKSSALFDHFVCIGEQGPRYRQTQDFHSLEVNHQQQLRWLLNAEVSRIDAPEDAIIASATRHSLHSIGESDAFAGDGGLMFYGFNTAGIHGRDR